MDASISPKATAPFRNRKRRREILSHLALILFGLALLGPTGRMLAAAAEKHPSGGTASLAWLDGAPPLSPIGVNWGVPWERAAMPRGVELVVRTADGSALPTQSWPLAFWPDGSVKWSGLAIAADSRLTGPFTVEAGAPPAPQMPVIVKEQGKSVEISTGPLVCRIAKQGAHLMESLAIDGKEVGRNARLIASREDRSEYASKGVLRQEDFTSRVSSVVVEQAGPVRAVVRISGLHSGAGREWLPFTVRLYFTAGLNSIRIVHSFVFDGEAQNDYLRGLGIAFTVPFREELQNRHVRFATDGDGVWAEPVLMSPGYREVYAKGAYKWNEDQLQGKRIPNLETLDPKVKKIFEGIAVWDSFKLNQLAPDSFSVDKRTGAACSWLHNLNGHRARGLAFLGDVSGGIAVGAKNFWQKYPSALEITGASTDAGELKLWFWSPDAPAMDLRHYDTKGHDLSVSYEDYEEGHSTPNGVANTHELIVWALGETPANATVASLAKTANEPPLLVCTPEQYHKTRVLGIWSLPDRSNPDTAAVEEQLDRAWNFYAKEVEQRRWYGFWDFGDFMRTYYEVRHGWQYDIGGHAWNETELVPNAWLWFTFLRTGRADAFRLAEAMTRNTSEVDVYHSGPFMGLGSRHNVSHWGCGTKEARISEAWLNRFYYYLTADERTGDLMREVLTVDQTIAKIQPLRKVLTRADEPILFRIGPDWLALASNWMTEWERTGDTRYRDYVLTGMKCIGAMPEAFTTRQAFRFDLNTKQLVDIGEPNLGASGFMVFFGGDQIMAELNQLIDCPEFNAAWKLLCENWASKSGGGPAKMRMIAFAAKAKRDPALKDKAWQLLKGSLNEKGRMPMPAVPLIISGPEVPEPAQETPPSLATPAVAQWALDVLTTMELARDFDAKK